MASRRSPLFSTRQAMQDPKRASPSGPPPFQGADALRNAREDRAGAGSASASAASARGSGANLCLPTLPGPITAVRRRHMGVAGAAAPRPPLLPARTCWTRLADAGSLMALCGIVCGGPLLMGMVWLPWAKHVIASKYTAQFRDGLPYSADWPARQLPDPARKQRQGQDEVIQLDNIRLRLRPHRSVFTPPAAADAHTLTAGMGAVP